MFHQSISPYYLSTSQSLGCTSLPSHTALEWYKKIKMIDNQIPDLNRAKMKGRSPLNFLKPALHSSTGNITATVLFFEQQVNYQIRLKKIISTEQISPVPHSTSSTFSFPSLSTFFISLSIFCISLLLFSPLVPIAFSNCL